MHHSTTRQSSIRRRRQILAGVAIGAAIVVAGDATLWACARDDSASAARSRRHGRSRGAWWSTSSTPPTTTVTIDSNAAVDPTGDDGSTPPVVPVDTDTDGPTPPPPEIAQLDPVGPDAPGAPAPNVGSWWKPTSAVPLALHWVLDGPLDLGDPTAMGTRDLSGNPLPEPDVYDIDGQMNTAATVAALHSRGKKVICYIDAGVYEDYRPDAASFPQSVVGSPDQGWNGSYWLDVRQIAVLEPIMRARIEDCRSKGFDAVEPDEIDGYSNDPGFPISYEDQIAYNRAVASWIHDAGLSAGLKGDIDQVRDLVDHFDWTLNEECGQYGECTIGGGGLQLFSNAGKAVWIAEYEDGAIECDVAVSNRFNAAQYRLGLPSNGGRQPCPGW